MRRPATKNRALFLKKRALLALYLAAPFYISFLGANELDRYFYDRPPDLLVQIADTLSWFFAPSALLTLMIGGNIHDQNALLLYAFSFAQTYYAFSFAQTYLVAFIIVMLAGAIRRAASRRAAKPAG